MPKITIHRALAELKTLDDRIQKAIAGGEFIGFQQRNKPVVGSMNTLRDEKAFKENAEAKYQQVLGLIKRKQQIKRAIVDSNAKTIVKIGDVEMTVADAITEKDAIVRKEEFIGVMQSQFNRAHASVNVKNGEVAQNLQKVIEATLGKDQTKVSKEDIENVSKPFMLTNEFIVTDPLELEKRINVLKDEVDKFKADVDAVLSESNAITFIEVAD